MYNNWVSFKWWIRRDPLKKLKERDEELIQEELKNVNVKEELIAREQIIKEKRAFLTTEAENNIELEKKIEIRERQNGKVREQRQAISDRATQMADDVKTLQYQAERARKDNDVRLFYYMCTFKGVPWLENGFAKPG